MTEQEQKKPKSRKRKVLTVVIILLAVLVALVVTALLYLYISQKMSEEPPEVYEGSVADLLKEVTQAQYDYFEKNKKFGSFKELIDDKLLKVKGLEDGRLGGYNYELTIVQDGQDWGLTAWPEKPGEETKSYFIDSTGEIRFEEYTAESQQKATADSPPLWEESDWGDEESDE